MRTNIEIDDTLMAEALAVSGLATKRAVVEAGTEDLAGEPVRRNFGRIEHQDSHDRLDLLAVTTMMDRDRRA